MHSVRASASKRVKLSMLAQSNWIDIPPDWLVKSLNEIATVNPQAINESYPHKEILYVDISSIENFQVQQYERIRFDQRPDRAQRIVRMNDIIVSTVRPNLKAFAKIARDDPNLVSSTGFAVIRPLYSEDVDFIFNYVRSHHFETNILRYMEGMAYPAITSKVVERSLIPYPSNRLERMKIASILSKVDDLIQKTDEIIEQTQRLKKGLLQTLFLRGIGHNEYKTIRYGTRWMTFQCPIEWDYNSLDKVAKFRQGLQIAKVKRYKEPGKDRIKLIKVTDFHSDKESDEYIDIPSMRSVICKKEDIIIARTGTLGLVLTDMEGVFHNNTFAIDYDKKLFDKMFFYYYLTTPIVQLYIKIISTRTSQADLTHKEFSHLIVPIPPIDEQRKIAKIIMNVEKQIEREYYCLSLYNSLKKGLMQKLLTGKIRVKV